MIQLESIAAFGKIFFIPTQESVPPLPEMSLLFLKEDERGGIFPWRAACIDLEIDAVGNSKNEAWENLKDALTMYINMEKKAADDNMIDTAKHIIETAFTMTDQKTEYINLYRKAKLQYTIETIESGKIPDPIEEGKSRIEKLASLKESIRYSTNDVLKKVA